MYSSCCESATPDKLNCSVEGDLAKVFQVIAPNTLLIQVPEVYLIFL
jgi:hypothetical protein